MILLAKPLPKVCNEAWRDLWALLMKGPRPSAGLASEEKCPNTCSKLILLASWQPAKEHAHGRLDAVTLFATSMWFLIKVGKVADWFCSWT